MPEINILPVREELESKAPEMDFCLLVWGSKDKQIHIAGDTSPEMTRVLTFLKKIFET